MDFLRRLLGLEDERDIATDLAAPEPDAGSDADGEPEVAAPPDEPKPALVPVACPSCGVVLDPPPVRNRRCPSCRQPIVVRRLEGRTVYLAEAAVAVFEAERKRQADEREWTAARSRWLRLATTVKAPTARRARIAAAPISAAAVEAARSLYLTSAEKVVRAARRDKRWGEVGSIRRDEAAALFAEAGSPIPPPEEVLALYREGMAGVLRALTYHARHVELVSSGDCPACRADEGLTARIADELRTPRLPHPGCPRGLCGCEWWPAVVQPARHRRRRAAARTSATAPAAGADAVEPAGDLAASGGDETVPTEGGGSPEGP